MGSSEQLRSINTNILGVWGCEFGDETLPGVRGNKQFA